MRRNKLKYLAAVVVVLMMSLFASFTAFADWDGEANWQYNWNGGNVFCRWDKCPGAKGYLLTVYKVNENNSTTVILGPVTVVGTTSKDVTQAIIKKGAGDYVFEVDAYSDIKYEKYEIIGELGSDQIYLDSNEISKISQSRTKQTTQTVVGDGWHQYPNNTWTYGKGNNTLAKNEWLCINDKWYHFDSKGYMQKGWQQINGNYYYLDATNGNLWVNCQTPDGYYVNADGVRIGENGEALTGTALNATVNITLEETGEDGKKRNCKVKGVSNANLVDAQFEIPYENWIVGTPVRLYVKVSSTNNFPFGKNSKFTCSQATVVGFSGSNPATVELLYYPKLKLLPPSNITLNSEGELSWHGSEYAQSYIVKIYNAGDVSSSSGVKTLNPQTTSKLDISEYLEDNNDVIIGITSIHAKTSGNSQARKYYLDSNETKNYDLYEVNSESKLTDNTFSGSTARLSYTDIGGNKAVGWQQLQGSWYYFGSDGFAKGPGWFQDKDGNWYYFNNQYKMVVGKVTDNGKDYYMNDGSNPNFPYGAWVH